MSLAPEFADVLLLLLLVFLAASYLAEVAKKPPRQSPPPLIAEPDPAPANPLPAPHPSSSKHRQFEIFVGVDRFKFTASHFIAFPGFRERLHGHNYAVSVRLTGPSQVGEDGYVLDFGDVKSAVTDLCKRLNEHFIYPSRSPVLEITERSAGAFRFKCTVDDSEFAFPPGDVLELPIAHSSAEEIAEHIWHLVVDTFTLQRLQSRGIARLEIGVAEAPNQLALFRQSIWHGEEAPPPANSTPRPCACHLSCGAHDANPGTREVAGPASGRP